MFDENGIFCIQSQREERWPPKFVEFCSVRAGSLGNVFAEFCVHFLFSRIREYCKNFFSFNLSLSLLLAAKMLVIPNKKLYTKMRKFFSRQYFLPKWHVIKTKHTCRFDESGIERTSGGWKFPEPTSLRSRAVSSGNFQPPSPPCKYVCYI